MKLTHIRPAELEIIFFIIQIILIQSINKTFLNKIEKSYNVRKLSKLNPEDFDSYEMNKCCKVITIHVCLLRHWNILMIKTGA